MSETISFTLNGEPVAIAVNPIRRLANVLREDAGLTGTKVGCDAGDCGACTVLVNGEQFCACMIAVAQVTGSDVVTVEGLADGDRLSELQEAFHVHGAAQCGICTPGMLMAAASLLQSNSRPDEREVRDALGGVLCRCTGYSKIIEAVMSVGLPSGITLEAPGIGQAVGARVPKTDGIAKVEGSEVFGADHAPESALWLRVVRSPHASATFSVGSFDALHAEWPGLAMVLTAADVTGNNGFGIYPDVKDQPVLAAREVRFRGEAVVALVGDHDSVHGIRDEDVPIAYQPRAPIIGTLAALRNGARQIHKAYPGNIMAHGAVKKGDAESALAASDIIVEGTFETGFVEHAYIEPEAGWARRLGNQIEVSAPTQSPYMDRDEIAQVIGIAPEEVRVIPTACGGGFGGKLDISVQPLVALAAWVLDRPVRCTYTRIESMASTTKRHPSRITARFGCTGDGLLTAHAFDGDFDTGAYVSWGRTVKDRVPVHSTGPYHVPAVLSNARGVFSNAPPSGAFRGFGVPQASIAHEALMDEMAERIAMDPLEFRHKNALRAGTATATGQVLEASCGLATCLDALRPHWKTARADTKAFNTRSRGPMSRGVGVACAWYGCGNTSMSNPSTMHVGVAPDGTVTLYSGAQDIGQGSNTTMIQCAADALGVDMSAMRLVWGDTGLTADAGKSSASRQAYVSGNAAKRAGEDLRRQILRLANVGEDAVIEFGVRQLVVRDADAVRKVDLSTMTPIDFGNVLIGEGTFDPPTLPPDENGQGSPYATYGFAAQLAEVEVDIELGLVRVRRMVAAHDVGRAINPIQVEGQIQGGIAQGIGLALMEEYVPGRTENLHDYLIPTIGDVPEIEVILVEDPEPTGPWGAKGVGEHALIPTAPAIFGAIYAAAGVRMTRAPATPDRVRAAILSAKEDAT